MAFEALDIGSVENDGEGDSYYTLIQKIKGNFEALKTGAFKNITISTEDPSGGEHEDIWIKYTP
jgi:hypothetical protein